MHARGRGSVEDAPAADPDDLPRNGEVGPVEAVALSMSTIQLEKSAHEREGQ